jgi:hypothetical protein
MLKKRKHSSCSLKDKLELLKRIDKGESTTKLALECGDYFFLHPVRINRNFGLARLYCTYMEPRSLRQYSVWLRTGRSGFDPRQGQRIFLLAPASRPALGPTQPPIKWVPGVLSPEVKRGRGVTLTTHPPLVPRLSMSRSYTSSLFPPPPCASMACSGTTDFTARIYCTAMP